eukprot:TRINITY_DN990_c0_g1_i2.p1 TRINITY_DN990_c0_g1~~TRINITY_DN990_c0_g1_i2.p1  ORF type:complete len:437 (-),score=117.37 TRINITY_DN990_c0_g1_i2:2838-4148(-)
MKVFLLVCLGLLLVVSSGWGDAAVDREDELSLKTLDTPALKDPSAGIPALRNIREAEKKQGKKGNDKNAKKKTSKSKKNKGRKRKNSKGNTQKKKNKKSVKGQNQKRKGKKNKKKKGKKNQTRKKNKNRTSAKEKNKGKNKNPTKVKQEKKKQKSGKGKNNSRKSKKGKNSRKKIKHAARKNKRKNKKSKTKSGRNAKKSKKGKNKSTPQGRLTCGSTQVNDTCLQNAVDALNFEKNQIQNFYKQKARLINHNKTTASKQGKKGEFEDAAKYLLQAIGGNLSAPTCGESGTAQKARSAKSASDTYKTLLNCSVSIKEACTMPTKTFNATIQATLDACATIYNISKMTSDVCRTESAFLTNGTLACECWSKAAMGIVIAKKNNCAATDTSKSVKAAKNKCITAFSVCKKAEDSAVGLIHTCMAGEVKNISATGRLIF